MRKKIICPSCGDVYYGSHKVERVETNMQAWIDKGYVKEKCIGCKSRDSFLAAERRLETSLLATEPYMVVSREIKKGSGRNVSANAGTN